VFYSVLKRNNVQYYDIPYANLTGQKIARENSLGITTGNQSQPTDWAHTQTLGVTSRTKGTRLLIHTKIYMKIHNMTNIRLCSTVQSIVRHRSTASDTEAAQETTTQGVRKLRTQCSHDSQHSTVSATKDKSAKPAGRRSNTGHTDFWRLQAL